MDRGEALLEIGDFNRMAAVAMVDEVDVVRLAVGQTVWVGSTCLSFNDATAPSRAPVSATKATSARSRFSISVPYGI